MIHPLMFNLTFVEQYEILESIHLQYKLEKRNVIALNDVIGSFYLNILNNSADLVEYLKELSSQTGTIKETIFDINNIEFTLSPTYKKIEKINPFIANFFQYYFMDLVKEYSKERNDYIYRIDKYKKRLTVLKNIKNKEDFEKYLEFLLTEIGGEEEIDIDNLDMEIEEVVKFEKKSYTKKLKIAKEELSLCNADSLKYEICEVLENTIKAIELHKKSLPILENKNSEKIKETLLENLSKFKMSIPRCTIEKVSIRDNSIDFLNTIPNANQTIALIYNVNNFNDVLSIYYKYFIDNNVTIKKCKNCGKYFIPHNKQVYCDNPSPQNPNKSCKSLSDDMRNNKSPVYELYRSNYKTQSSKKRRNINNIPNIEKKFDKWNKLAKEKMKECEKGNLDIEEYKKWLKESQDWIKNL